MKKLLLFLLIFALFLTGCSAPAPVEGEKETPDVPPTEEQTPTPDDDTPKLPASTIIYPEPQPERKPPAVPITNKNDPQDETADFLFVFDVKYGEFARGEQMDLEIKMINNMETSYTWFGSSSTFFPFTQLYCIANGEKYKISVPGYDITTDSGPQEIKPRESQTRSHYFTIPEDAPLGEYVLSCSFNGKTTEFEGYFTLTQ